MEGSHCAHLQPYVTSQQSQSVSDCKERPSPHVLGRKYSQTTCRYDIVHNSQALIQNTHAVISTVIPWHNRDSQQRRQLWTQQHIVHAHKARGRLECWIKCNYYSLVRSPLGDRVFVFMLAVKSGPVYKFCKAFLRPLPSWENLQEWCWCYNDWEARGQTCPSGIQSPEALFYIAGQSPRGGRATHLSR